MRESGRDGNDCLFPPVPSLLSCQKASSMWLVDSLGPIRHRTVGIRHTIIIHQKCGKTIGGICVLIILLTIFTSRFFFLELHFTRSARFMKFKFSTSQYSDTKSGRKALFFQTLFIYLIEPKIYKSTTY